MCPRLTGHYSLSDHYNTTYIKIAGGMVYMAAVIDWNSKAVLSHRISSTMDSQLVMSVLNDSIERYPHPDIY